MRATYDDGETYESRWSQVSYFDVRDEAIRLRYFTLSDLHCIRKLHLRFGFWDNSQSQQVDMKLDFFKRREGGYIASLKGTTRAEFGFNSVSDYFQRPQRLQLGERYFSRLRLTDEAGHRARSGFESVTLRRC